MNIKHSIKICAYNIISGHNSRLALAMKAIRSMNIDLGLLTKTKLTDNTYTMDSNRYEIFVTPAASKHQGGVALFYDKKSPLFAIEGTKTFGPNVIWVTLISSGKRRTLLGYYIPPSDHKNTTLNYLQVALQHDINHELILLGDLNVNLRDMQGSNPR
jgi:exonuclease III